MFHPTAVTSSEQNKGFSQLTNDNTECSGDNFSPWSTCLNTSCWDQSGRVATSVFETFSSKELRSIRDTVFLVNFTLVFQLNRFQTKASSS